MSDVSKLLLIKYLKNKEILLLEKCKLNQNMYNDEDIETNYNSENEAFYRVTVARLIKKFPTFYHQT